LPGQRQRSEVILQRVRVLAAPPLSAQAQDRHEVTLEVFEEAATQLEQIRPHLLGEAFALRVRGADQGLVTHDDGRVNPRALALARSVAPAPAP
ncbi:MAG: hypothetical protein OER86_10920, partial [Phycisphaerae bacterium]|nr:hypothetical protein [Phycisphaerae bacterium]